MDQRNGEGVPAAEVFLPDDHRGNGRGNDNPSEQEEVAITVEDEVAVGWEPEQTQRLINQYLEEIKHEIKQVVEPLPETAGSRQMVWLVGLVTLAVALLLSTVLWHHTMAVSALGQATALHERAACGQRQAEVMRAITAYTQEHGEPPKSLTQLSPRYLAYAATDPVNGRALNYTHDGGAVWVACPQHPLPPSASALDLSVLTLSRKDAAN
jgi:hypothetical protein